MAWRRWVFPSGELVRWTGDEGLERVLRRQPGSARISRQPRTGAVLRRRRLRDALGQADRPAQLGRSGERHAVRWSDGMGRPFGHASGGDLELDPELAVVLQAKLVEHDREVVRLEP
jgi:hypothetical protein